MWNPESLPAIRRDENKSDIFAGRGILGQVRIVTESPRRHARSLGLRTARDGIQRLQRKSSQ